MPLPETVRILSAAAEPSRLRILAALRGRRLCVCELCAALGLKQSVMSQHLRVLRGAGLVEPDRRGYFVHYRLSQGAAERCEMAMRRLFERRNGERPCAAGRRNAQGRKT